MKLIHKRSVEVEIFDRGDDMFLAVGRLTDLKGEPVYTYSKKRVGPGEAFHDLKLEMLVKFPELEIRQIQAQMEEIPGEPCEGVVPHLKKVEGLKIEGGLQRTLNDILGGVKGCVHFNNLIIQMAHAILQAYWGREFQSLDKFREPHLKGFLNSCFVWDETKEVAKEYTCRIGSEKP